MIKSKIQALALSASLLVMASATNAADSNTLFRNPTLNDSHIVFSYAGDLWRVARSGGAAEKLTSGVGIEDEPRFSPDGSMIAFTGQYDGNTDAFVMPASGGTPKRLTFHPGPDQVTGWTVDGKSVVFNSRRNSYANFLRLFTVDATSPSYPTQIDLPSAERGSFNSTGTHLAYEPLNQWQPDWKRYHGGQQDKIWIAKLDDASIQKIPHKDSSDKSPMWIGDKVYFLSDRGSKEGSVRLFSYNPKNKKVKQLLDGDGLDIKSASAGPNGVIVYEQFGTIHTFDTKTGTSSPVNITVNADLTSVRPHYKKVGDDIRNSGISPTGKRAVFEARGEIFTVAAKKGEPRNITNTPGVMERSPAWSPSGEFIAYFSDEGGEYKLHVRDQKGHKPAKVYDLPKTFYYAPTWSPDSTKIAFFDKTLKLWYLNLEAEGEIAPALIDENLIGLNDNVMVPSWSPDGNWIAYVKQLPNLLRAVHLFSLETGTTHQITDGMSDARYLAFDKKGKYLHFTASTNMGPTISFADMSGVNHNVSRSVYSVALAADTMSPLAPESDEEDVKPAKKPKADNADTPEEPTTEESGKDGSKGEEGTDKDNAKSGEKKKADKASTKVDLEGIGTRIIALPFPAKNYVALTVDGSGTVLVTESIPSDRGPSGRILHGFSPKTKKVKKVGDGIRNLQISADGKSALYSRNPTTWAISATGAIGKPVKPGAGALATGQMEALVDPKQEWAQMYHAVWRGQRDFFYDKNGHGIDFDLMEKRYAPYVEAVQHRSDLTYLFREMANEMTIGHMFIRGGDQERAKRVPGGLLGADYTVKGDHYQISKIYNGENWNPNLVGPLAQPGLNVKVGDYLLEVNGRKVMADKSIYSFFESTAGKQTRIKIGPNTNGDDARELIVVPTRNESGLRHIDWKEGNRRKVDALSGGKLAYIYMPNTGGSGVTSFNRYFFSQTDKSGAVLDERFNGGGLLADYVVQLFTRDRLANIHYRDGKMDVPVPGGAIYGPKAMLINEMAGSGGDAMPWFFKTAKVGPLIGKQTWGGLVAAFGIPQLMDGGRVTAPDAAIYGLDGEWEVENFGVAPDIEVDFEPAAWRAGRDPQLERAVSYLMKELKKNPPKKYKRPDYPVYKRD